MRDSLPFNMCLIHLYFCLVFSIDLLSSANGGVVTIQFETERSPPTTVPIDFTKRVYSIALDAITSVPLVAHIYDDGVLQTSGPLSSVTFKLESLDDNVRSDAAFTDPWVNSGGNLCQWGVEGPFPKRMQRKYFTFICPNTTTLENRTADRGALIVDGLLHRHPGNNLPGLRFYRVTATLPDGNTVYADSNSFNITRPVGHIEISQEPPASIIANTDFSVEVTVYDRNGAVLTDGADSVQYVELQVAWEPHSQLFYSKLTKEEILFEEKVRLRGPEAVKKLATQNYVIRKRFSGGSASFTGLRLLDAGVTVRLNATIFQSNFPWVRRPDEYTDFASRVDDGTLFYMNTSYAQDPAVALTQEITVEPQVASSIQIVGNPHSTQCANCPVDPPLLIQILDGNNERIFSGPDSTLNVSVTTLPTVCLSSDSEFALQNGEGYFRGSICEAVVGVSLKFSVTSVAGLVINSSSTIAMTINNEVHLANFIDLKYGGGGPNIGPHMDSMIHYAKEDVNAGKFGILSGRNLVVHSYDTENRVSTTIREYKKMVAMGEANPATKVRGVIGFGGNSLSEKLQPLLTADKIPQLATREDLYEFGDKTVYPYYSRICWDMGSMSQSVMLAAKSRGWTKTVMLRNMEVDVSTVFYEKAKSFGIDIIEITIPTVPLSQYGTHGIFSEEMAKVKKAGTKIIWVFVRAPLLWKLTREAVIAGIAPMHGYQWITVGIISWHIPYGNTISLCQINPLCTVALTGNNGFSGTYNLKGLRTVDWEHALTRHIKRDRMYYYGTIPKHTLIVTTAEFALGYDALRVYAEAVDILLTEQKTLTAANLVDAVRQVQFEGLTGLIKFNEKGNRPGYYGFICVTDPHPPELGVQIAAVAIISRYFELNDESSTDQVEYTAEAQWPLNLPPFNLVTNPYVLPNTSYLNKRRYNSSDGMINLYQEVVPIPPKSTPAANVELEEYAVAPFYCEAGCGGLAIDEYDITRYEQGDCVDMNQCLCHDGYFGPTCGEMICQCRNGRCEVPRICICDAGYEGDICQHAICSTPCEHGRCTAPDVCTCDSGYVGSSCGDQLAVIVTLPLLSFIGLIIGAVFFARWFLRRQALKAALANLDWLVKWDEEVQTGIGAISMVSTANEDIHTKPNYVSWKSQKCFAQKFKCDSLNVNNPDLRLEIVHLKEFRHTNIVQFVGACLDYPNVSILTEICPKGSLEDLLSNEAVRLGWDFKYSLLKDICRGMDHLHRTVFVSHGRLKSTNCLVDNRWTCKISGFGAPTLRYLGPRKETTEHAEEPANVKRELFWTAPELLNHETLDNVGKGTPAGDVYSFAIIMTEVISREEPYVHDMANMTADDVIMLVKDKNAQEAARAKRRWYESGGDTTKLFRPKIEDSHLPEEYAAKSGLRKLVEQNWNDHPEQRLTFRQNLDRLNEIYPIKGELIDNLVNMLEKYSSNLEAIVADRTKELIAEKARTDQLISQMLPKSVAEDLKHGKSTPPESFECVTIFFSDLVGFTAIAKESTPLQVVDLLNDLYTTFDAILDDYDVYKVETIGDAYMVVSGLPIRNGDEHAGQIASVSLDLLSSVCDFRIRHMPDKTLQLRIGMHSGPAVAGVVGSKMPRYCLFGDTVNTASRMESSSMALRIHMSETTAKILFKLGGYHLECRGEREVKGKGVMTTYWLLGKDGFNKPLPSLDLALSKSKHEFK